MELDDLRQQWQRPAAPDVPLLTEQSLRAMLANPTESPVARMKRNARRDLGLGLAVVVLNFFNLQSWFRFAASRASGGVLWWSLLLGSTGLLVVLWNTGVKMRILSRMEGETSSLRDHLLSLVHQFRGLLRASVRTGLGLAALLVLLLLYAGYEKLVFYLRPGAGDQLTHWLLFGSGVLATLLAFGLAYKNGNAVRQRRYGQYLDRLEANLRELDEPGPGGA